MQYKCRQSPLQQTGIVAAVLCLLQHKSCIACLVSRSDIFELVQICNKNFRSQEPMNYNISMVWTIAALLKIRE